MHSIPHDHTRTRIRRLRRERGLTQALLAELSGLSTSQIKKVEQGQRPPTPHFVASVARGMRVDVATVTGQPYTTELRADQLDVLIRPIREALDVYDLGADPEIMPRPLRLLSDDAEALLVAVRAGEIKQAASQLPGLIQEVTTAAHAAPSDELWRLLASTYRSAYDVASKLGYSDLAAIALARLEWAAERASSAALGGMYRYFRAITYLRDGQYRTGQRLTELGLRILEQAEPGREREVVTGQLHLGAAVTAGRSHQRDQADGHLAEAERIAARTGEATTLHYLAFGPTNVEVHRVSILAELDDYGQAAQLGREVVIPKDWPASRRSHHYAELARAQMWTGQLDDSFKNLLRARKAAPQQARYHVTVRETYDGLEAAHRLLPDSFLSFGSWLAP
ncbi:helix-turn-helix transcriptional regulator [Streptomyces xanthophaeus]|uniref:helix-turn-helix domain-containing protein n=1 Tax=Streptomyces xanthophaeus TaxID=67385 RepID=UPI00386534AC|nr:helix-turn-helix transcriptional regulator [Streptomyces xanthophaeus]WST62131.1 helix-turn-helix transcriptional regulator [Streptomyces xanthophaeus]